MALTERDEVVVARQETARKALALGEEAFKNGLEQVVALSSWISLETAEANTANNVLGGVLVEYDADKTCHEVHVAPKVPGAPEE